MALGIDPGDFIGIPRDELIKRIIRDILTPLGLPIHPSYLNNLSRDALSPIWQLVAASDQLRAQAEKERDAAAHDATMAKAYARILSEETRELRTALADLLMPLAELEDQLTPIRRLRQEIGQMLDERP